MQEHERGGAATGLGLPEAVGGSVGRGEVPAEAGGEIGKEEARALGLMLHRQ